MGILTVAAFVIISTTNRFNSYSPVQLVSGRDIILPIKSNLGKVTILSPQKKWCDRMFTPNLNIDMRHKGQLFLSFGFRFGIYTR